MSARKKKDPKPARQETRQEIITKKLRAVYSLQIIDRKLAEIEAWKGELPLEVRDLEDEIIYVRNRLEKLWKDVEETEAEIRRGIHRKEEIEIKIKRLEEQLENVQSSKEYNQLKHQLDEFQTDQELLQREIHSLQEEWESLRKTAQEQENLLKELEMRLAEKRRELQQILQETEKEENLLNRLREKFVQEVQQMDERLYRAYERIRAIYRNRQAVVTFERDACGGCFFLVPPQRQLEVARREAIFPCENCGRILIDQDLAKEVEKEMEAFLEKHLGRASLTPA